MQKTKTQTAHVETWNTREVHRFFYYNGGGWTQEFTGSTRFSYPDNTIVYDVGPKYLLANPRHCNWKACSHSGFISQFSGASYNCQQLSMSNNHVGGLNSQYDAYGVNPFSISLPFPSAPPADPVDIKGLADKMYADLVGRVDQYFLSLESLAGLFGGQSFTKAIGGVANATNKVGKAIRDLNKLRAAFGSKASLYNMWLSSKELVRQLIGFNLGYRFAFKATLSDIEEAVSAVTSFQSDVQRLSFRNDGRVHMYSKNTTSNSKAESIMSGSDFVNAFRRAFPVSPNPIQNLPASAAPDAVLRSRETVHAKLFSWAKVSYPAEYVTAKRILQSKFGLDKPLSTLWAIVPCSFVVDYLVRVQDYLESLDNKLNEYSVAVDVKDAWLVMSKTRVNEIEWPGVSQSFPYGSGISGGTNTFTCPPLHATKTLHKEFVRTPFPVGSIMSELGPLFRTDSENWTTRVGTGLELLLTKRLR